MRLTIYALLVISLTIFSCKNPNQKKTEAKVYVETISLSGQKEINEDLIVPENTLLEIKPGTKLFLEDGVRIIVEGKILAKGTNDNPIIFTTKDSTILWRGIEITGLEDVPETDIYWEWLEMGNKKTEDEFFSKIEQGNIFEYCQFSNTSPLSKKFERVNKWKGTIEAYNTQLRVSQCVFDDIHHFGGVLTQRSLVVVNNCLFDDISMHKAINSTDRSVGLFYNNTIIGHRACNARCADGIWTKAFTGLIANNHIETVADDGIDTDGSRVIIVNNAIEGVFDDGIDIDNKGYAYIIDNSINGVFENGILMSDGSQIIAVQNEISNSNCGIALRDGAEVVTEGLNIHNNKYGVILYQNLPTLIDKIDFERIKTELSAMSIEEINAEEYIEGVEGSEDLIKMLDIYYEDRGDYYIFRRVLFKKIKKLDPLKKLFKLVGTVDLINVNSKEVKDHPLNLATKNGLYLSSAIIIDNDFDVSPYHHYNLKMDGCTFSSKKVEQKILDNCHCDENHQCEIIDKLNTSGVEINTKKIIKKLKAI